MEFRQRVTKFYRQILWMVSCLLGMHGFFLLGMLTLYFYTSERFFAAIVLSHGLIYLLIVLDMKKFVSKALDIRKLWYQNLAQKTIVKKEETYAENSLHRIRFIISKYVFLFLCGLGLLSVSIMMPIGDFQMGSGIGLTICGSSGLVMSTLLQWTFNFYHHDMQYRYNR